MFKDSLIPFNKLSDWSLCACIRSSLSQHHQRCLGILECLHHISQLVLRWDRYWHFAQRQKLLSSNVIFAQDQIRRKVDECWTWTAEISCTIGIFDELGNDVCRGRSNSQLRVRCEEGDGIDILESCFASIVRFRCTAQHKKWPRVRCCVRDLERRYYNPER